MKNLKKRINEFIRCIRERGYAVNENDNNGQIGEIHLNGESLCILFENGELSTNAYRELSLIHRNVKEYLSAFEKADELKVSGLIEGYRKLFDFNGYVLAMRENKYQEYEFVTWHYSPDHQSVNIGRYYSDYENAKENMAIRSGLVDEMKLFSETDLKLIHSSLVTLVGTNEDTSYQQEKAIGSILDKIEIIIPEILNHQDYEEKGLLADDGLEL